MIASWMPALLALAAPAALAEPARWGQAPAPTRHADLGAAARPVPGPEVADGSWVVWRWPDQTVEHVDRFLPDPAGGPPHLVERRRYDAGGGLLETALWAGGTPTTVTLTGAPPTRLDVGTWRTVDHGPLRLWLPGEPAGGSLRDPAGTWLLATTPGMLDPTSPAVLDDLRLGAGAVVLDVATACVDGRPAARITLDLPDANAPAVAEVFLVPLGGTTWTVTFVAPRGTAAFSLDTLAPGRASLLLARVEASPAAGGAP